MKKEQIIESARELFIRYGYKKVSMNEIAEEAGVTKKTIYSYFKDKDELLRYFLLEEKDKMKKIIEKIEAKKQPFFETVHETIYEMLKYKKQAKFIVSISREAEKAKSGSVIEALKIIDESIRDYIKEKLQYAIDKKYIRECNIEIAAFLIYKIYIALMVEWDNESMPLDEKEISDNITRLLKEGLMN